MAFAKAEALTMVCMKNRFWTLIARRSKLHIACSDFFKSQSALIALLLLSKSNPLRWASIWFWAQSRKKIDFTHLLQLRNSRLRSVSGSAENCTAVGISSLSAANRSVGFAAVSGRGYGLRPVSFLFPACG